MAQENPTVQGSAEGGATPSNAEASGAYQTPAPVVGGTGIGESGEPDEQALPHSAAVEGRLEEEFGKEQVTVHRSNRRLEEVVGGEALTMGDEVGFGASAQDQGMVSHEMTHVGGGDAWSNKEPCAPVEPCPKK